MPISGIPRGPANAGGLNNTTIDPSGIGPQLQTHMTVSTQSGETRNPAAPPSMNLNEQALPEALGEGDASRAPIECHRRAT